MTPASVISVYAPPTAVDATLKRGAVNCPVLGIMETLGAVVSALATVLVVDVHKTGNNSEEEFVEFMITPVAFPLNPPIKVVPVTVPVNVAVDPWKDPERVIPPAALMPALNLTRPLNVPPAALKPLLRVKLLAFKVEVDGTNDKISVLVMSPNTAWFPVPPTNIG